MNGVQSLRTGWGEAAMTKNSNTDKNSYVCHQNSQLNHLGIHSNVGNRESNSQKPKLKGFVFSSHNKTSGCRQPTDSKLSRTQALFFLFSLIHLSQHGHSRVDVPLNVRFIFGKGKGESEGSHVIVP